MARYVALLRGINVGGNNLIKMPALKACFEEHGFTEVATYIQSGNVLFSSKGTTTAITKKVEKALADTFGFPIPVVVKSRSEMERVVEAAPRGFGKDPTRYRYDVLFLKAPLTAKKALADVPAKEGVDEKSAGDGVLYFSRLISKATQSRLSRVVALPIYRSMTIRNWNTSTKLAALLTAE